MLHGMRRPSDDAEEQTATQEIGPAERHQLHRSRVGRWLKTLEHAEWMRASVHLTYAAHSHAELVAFVEKAIRNHRTDGRLTCRRTLPITTLACCGSPRVPIPDRKRASPHLGGAVAGGPAKRRWTPCQSIAGRRPRYQHLWAGAPG
jgi:hypothetical protein